jgi:hypothetical protein
MPRLRWVFFLLLVALSPLAQGATILLPQGQELPQYENSLRGLEHSVRKIAPELTSASLAIAGSTLSRVAQLKANPTAMESWRFDPELRSLLGQLGDAATLERTRSARSGTSPLALGLSMLVREYGAVSARTANPEKYLSALLSILSATQAGKKVITCFFGQPQDSRIAPASAIRLAPPGFKGKGGFSLERIGDGTGMYQRVLHFDPGLGPFESIPIIAHELQHSCRSLQILEEKFALEGTRAPVKSPSIQQNYAADEMSAYRTQVLTFAELAHEAPELAAAETFFSLLYGQILSATQYEAGIAAQLADGTFPQYLIGLYAMAGFYDAGAVLKVDAKGKPLTDPQGRFILQDSLRVKIVNDLGLPVATSCEESLSAVKLFYFK